MSLSEELKNLRDEFVDYKKEQKEFNDKLLEQTIINTEQLKIHIQNSQANAEQLLLLKQFISDQHEKMEEEAEKREKEIEEKIDPMVKHVDRMQFLYSFVINTGKIASAITAIAAAVYLIFF